MAASTRAARIIPLRPMVVPPAATACHECADVPGTQHAVEKPDRRHDPGDVAHVGRAAAPLPRPVRDAAQALQRRRLGQGLLNAFGELLFPASSYFRSLSFARLARATRAQRLVGHDLEDAAEVLRFQTGLGGEGTGLGTFEESRIERLHDRPSAGGECSRRLRRSQGRRWARCRRR